MSISITFKPDTFDGEVKDNKISFPKGLEYLSVRVEASDEEYSGFVSGWVRPEVRSLVKAAPEMLEALRSALVVLQYSGDEQSRLAEQIMAAIAKATGAT